MPDNEYISPVSTMGYFNLVITLIKYTPAAYWNYKRKSTEGWSIFNMILDLLGACFSFASSTLSLTNGLNLAKFILAIISILYDLFFIFQHYCLYNKNRKKPAQERLEKLIEESESTGEYSSEEYKN
jgi:cystinosin